MNSTIALLILIGIVGAIWWFLGEPGRAWPIWKLVYFILAVCTLMWLLDITGIWRGTDRVFGRHSENGTNKISRVVIFLI
jgi:cytochrome c oxidase assembly factor CtaG